MDIKLANRKFTNRFHRISNTGTVMFIISNNETNISTFKVHPIVIVSDIPNENIVLTYQ